MEKRKELTKEYYSVLRANQLKIMEISVVVIKRMRARAGILSKRLNASRFLVFLCIFSLVAGFFFQHQTFAQPEGNTLYLYFPTTSDNTYTEFGKYGATTSPAEPFDVADLDSGIGTTSQLRENIFDMVTDDYCEFDVEVIRTTSAPNPTEARWVVVAIGSDSETMTYGGIVYDLFGISQLDVGDNNPQDYARVWAGTFEVAWGSAGEALAGTNSTLERWATAIAGTTTHEAAHNYGVQHDDADPRAGSVEDATRNHILATGTTLTGDDRASLDRHFSDTAYEILGANLGLTIDTLHNWHLVNPNDVNAHALQLEILSEASTLTIGWFYNYYLRSPWTDPTISATGSTVNFQGTIYNVFELNYSTPLIHTDGFNGVAPPGVLFHVGTTFVESDAVIVRDVKLFDSGGDELPLAPRLFGYDAGTLNNPTGDFDITFYNFDVDRPLILSSLEVSLVPRMMDINSMVENATQVDRTGIPVTRTTSCQWAKEMEIVDELSINIARLTDDRTVDFAYDPEDCEPGIIGREPEALIASDIDKGEIVDCPDGTALSLFPSTYVYVTATVVDPEAKYWDPNQGKFVEGPLETTIFYQFSGFKPDLNNNGVDDLLDIRTGTSEDENDNGIPDEVEKQPEPPIKEPPYETLLYYIYILLAAIIALIFFILFKLRKIII